MTLLEAAKAVANHPRRPHPHNDPNSEYANQMIPTDYCDNLRSAIPAADERELLIKRLINLALNSENTIEWRSQLADIARGIRALDAKENGNA